MAEWTKEDKKLLRKEYPNTDTYDVASMLGRGYEAVKKQAQRMGLRKSKAYLKKLGRK